MNIRIAAVLASLAFAAAPAQAVITSITLTGGTAFTNGGVGQIIAQPATFAATGNNLQGFNELQNVVIGVGAQSPRGSIFDQTGLNVTTVSNIVSTLPVSSHFFHLTRATGAVTATGTISFNQNVIAVQRGSGLWAVARSAQLHNGTTNFATLGNNPGTETSDIIRLVDQNTISFDLNIGGNNSDAFRVLTAVPEPSTWAMLLVGFGLVGFARRRSTTVVAA